MVIVTCCQQPVALSSSNGPDDCRAAGCHIPINLRRFRVVYMTKENILRDPRTS